MNKRIENCERMLEQLITTTANMNEKLQQLLSKSEIEHVSFYDWALHWLDVWKKGHVKDNSYWGTYFAPTLVHLIPYFGNMLLDEITTELIQEYFNIKANVYTLETLKKDSMCLRAIFDTAAEANKCFKSPFTKRVHVYSNVPPMKKQAWSEEQYQTALRYARKHRFGLDVMVLMETGITRSELLGLTWDDFDYQNRWLRLTNGLIETHDVHTGKYKLVHDGLKNKYRQRIIPISSELAIRLKCKKRYRKLRDGRRVYSNLIFPSPTGKMFSPKNWYNRVLKVFMADLQQAHPEIPSLTTHELRHTRATVLFEKDCDLYTIQKLLGHRDTEMLTRIYLHMKPDVLRRNLNI